MSEAPSLRRALIRATRTDLEFFVRRVFDTIAPGIPYIDNWHISAIVYELMEVLQGRNPRLVVNQPPRSLKSICTSIALPAFALGLDPSLQIICVSYSNDLALRFAREFRKVVKAAWYQAAFPQMRIRRDTDVEFSTTEGGGRFATSTGGTLTGVGADLIVIDDPMKAEDALSEAILRSTNEWFGGTLVSRLNDKSTGAIVLVMQRLHQNDLAGYLLAEDDAWRLLKLPAIARVDHSFPLPGGGRHLFGAGEPLQPIREPLTILESIRNVQGTLNFTAQYLQEPENPEGNLFKDDWIIEDEPPPLHHGTVVQSWDTAQKLGLKNDYSVCATFLILPDSEESFLLDIYRARLNYPDLYKAVCAQAAKYKAGTVLIEDAGSGTALCQELPHDSIPFSVVPITPVKDKITRFAFAQRAAEQGLFLVPHVRPWYDTMIREFLGFPLVEHDDQVDAVSQYFQWKPSRAVVRATRIRGFA